MRKIIINTRQLQETVTKTLANPTTDFSTNLDTAMNNPNAEMAIVATPNGDNTAITQTDKEIVKNAAKDPKTTSVQIQNKNGLSTTIPTDNNTIKESRYTKTQVEKMRLAEIRRCGKVMTKKELEESFKK